MKELLESYKDNNKALEAIRLLYYTNDSVFLTGKAGTGKSTLLLSLLKNIHKRFICLAPTGIAALNIKGQTIHSFFGFKFRPYLPNDNDVPILGKEKVELLKQIELIVIDEISMVRCDLMNAIDITLRKNLKSSLPFAGKQLLLVGDLYQLPPIVDNKSEEIKILDRNYTSRFFYSAKVFEKSYCLHMVKLEKVYRQKDDIFISILDRIRTYDSESQNEEIINDLKTLNTRFKNNSLESKKLFTIVLTTNNEIARKLNAEALMAIQGEKHELLATKSGSFNTIKESMLPAPSTLTLKVGAQVIFTKNDRDKRWVNGSLGKIRRISNEILDILLDDNITIVKVSKVIWEDILYYWNEEEDRIESKIIGTFSQFPIKLAWSITIHKSQGQTFDQVIIDLSGGTFEFGQLYVALSRCRSLQGITLTTLIQLEDIKVNPRIKKFYDAYSLHQWNVLKLNSIIQGIERQLIFKGTQTDIFKDQITRIESTISQQKLQNENLNKDLSTYKALINTYKTTINTLENTIQRKNIELARQSDQIKKLNSRISDYNNKGNNNYYLIVFLIVLISIIILIVIRN